MTEIVKTIGTSGRDYSTIAAWEADLDNGAVYSGGDDAVGEIYNDSVFDESVVVNGGGTIGLNSIKLTVAATERHDGTAGTGARNVITSSPLRGFECVPGNARPITIEWLEIDAATTSHVIENVGGWNSAKVSTRHCIIHGVSKSAGTLVVAIHSTSGGRRTEAIRNVVYDIENTEATFAASGISLSDTFESYCIGNTVHDIRSDNGSTNVYCISATDDADMTIQNNIATDPGGTTSGTKQCYETTSYANATCSYNLASDTSASGTGSLDSKAAADQFVSTVGGSEDLHLKVGADAVDAGIDLVTSPTGVNFDIDNRDLDTAGDTWDMGADEFTGAGSAVLQAEHYRRQGGSQ